MTLYEIETTVILGWLSPGLVIMIFAWPKIAILLAIALLAWLA